MAQTVDGQVSPGPIGDTLLSNQADHGSTKSYLSLFLRTLLATILLAAFAVRILGIADTPPGFQFDEGYYALDGLEVLNGNVLPFYPRNGGRESLFMLVIAPFIAVLGRDPLAVRLPAAFFGVLTVAATFSLGRRLFRSSHGAAASWIGLAGAGLAAGSLWLFLFNRIGLRINAFPFALAVAGYWFWRSFEDRRRRDWLVAGLAFGLVQYTYTAARVVPAIIPGYLGLRALLDFELTWLLRRWHEWLVFLIAAVIAISPLAGYAVTHSDEFLRRQAALSPLNEAKSTQPPAERYLSALAGTLPMFVNEGDLRIFRNFPGKPVFDLAIAPFFVVGLLLVVWRFRRPAYGFILLWLGIMLLAAAVPLGVVPHYAHDFGFLPILFLVPALGLVEVASFATRRGLPGALAGLAVAGLVAGSGAWSEREYFGEWARLPDTPNQFDADMAEIAGLMNDRGAGPDLAFVIDLNRLYGKDYIHGSVAFLYHGSAPYRFVRVDETDVADQLAKAVQGRRTVVRFERAAERDIVADGKELVDFLLARQGIRVADEFRRGFRMTTYQLDAPLAGGLAPGGEREANSRFGDRLTLASWAAGVSPRRDRVWALARWRASDAFESDLKASIRLRDSDGRVVALADRDLLRDPLFEPTSVWEGNEQEATYHLLDLPPGLPPGRYRLSAVVYDAESGRALAVPGGSEVALGDIELGPAASVDLPGELAIPPASLGPVVIVGRGLPGDPVRPGDQVPIVLFWKSGTAPASDAAVSVRIVDRSSRSVGGWTGTLLEGRYPPSQWRPGELVRTAIDLKVDATAPNGLAKVEVAWGGGQPAFVGDIRIAGRERRFDLPVIQRSIGATAGDFGRLAGWSTANAANGLTTIEFVWQAIGPATRNWTVFVHLIGPDGRIVAQSDRQPDDGRAPTASWLAGEVIVDRHEVRPMGAGPFRVVLGMYDPMSGERVGFQGRDAIDLGSLP